PISPRRSTFPVPISLGLVVVGVAGHQNGKSKSASAKRAFQFGGKSSTVCRSPGYGRILLHRAHTGRLPLGLAHMCRPIPEPHAVGERLASPPGRARRRSTRTGQGGGVRRQRHVWLQGSAGGELSWQLRRDRREG